MSAAGVIVCDHEVAGTPHGQCTVGNMSYFWVITYDNANKIIRKKKAPVDTPSAACTCIDMPHKSFAKSQPQRFEMFFTLTVTCVQSVSCAGYALVHCKLCGGTLTSRRSRKKEIYCVSLDSANMSASAPIKQQVTAPLYIGDVKAATAVDLAEAGFTHVVVRTAPQPAEM